MFAIEIREKGQPKIQIFFDFFTNANKSDVEI